MMTNATLLLMIVTMSSVASQTFQYSRGWTNGKRGGQKHELTLEKILNPCQMDKLKYLLEGKPLTEKILTPCNYIEEDNELPKRFSSDRGQDSLYDAFQ
ncbi:pro-corazonin-like [Melitaea cinxia]|uniref:pro-corazonin-like n=1 Tax=Melitaea cinxia TaxID=113334 RepID=UPI001E26FACB|nr:pro-corazonin-like [Melitaea cinxia]